MIRSILKGQTLCGIASPLDKNTLEMLRETANRGVLATVDAVTVARLLANIRIAEGLHKQELKARLEAEAQLEVLRSEFERVQMR